MTIPLSSTRSRTSMRLLLLVARSTTIRELPLVARAEKNANPTNRAPTPYLVYLRSRAEADPAHMGKTFPTIGIAIP